MCIFVVIPFTFHFRLTALTAPTAATKTAMRVKFGALTNAIAVIRKLTVNAFQPRGLETRVAERHERPDKMWFKHDGAAVEFFADAAEIPRIGPDKIALFGHEEKDMVARVFRHIDLAQNMKAGADRESATTINRGAEARECGGFYRVFGLHITRERQKSS